MDSPPNNQASNQSKRAGNFDSLPFLTADLPGTGGTLKQEPEDFVVEEIPAYEPCGEGEHLFLWVEKQDVSGEELLRHVARRLAIPSGDIGMAGIKDRRAITRQWISVPVRSEPLVTQIETERIRVLRAVRHGNKLRTGHLRGNRFSICVRDVTESAADRAERIAEIVARLGFPNYFGAQRFGNEGQTLQLGLDLLAGKVSARSIPAARRRFLLRMALSAAQSALFNSVLAARLKEVRLHTVLAGDVMQVATSGGQFVVDDQAAEQKRFDARETVVTGPIFGPNMRAPQENAGECELAVLAEWNLSAADFSRFPKLTSGTRRPLIARPGNLAIRTADTALRIDFELASGCYATSLLREFMKSPAGNE
ncbi:MAG TPA: tRNA pseudouridine(13) synthase TruD [Planctomycetaceae bacterium]|jgi:tRNA pseudouridine13 synthase|nr:tRNA pseudouridine(13) synthase TruD [Planctomycetaceae bacterium]